MDGYVINLRGRGVSEGGFHRKVRMQAKGEYGGCKVHGAVKTWQGLGESKR